MVRPLGAEASNTELINTSDENGVSYWGASSSKKNTVFGANKFTPVIPKTMYDSLNTKNNYCTISAKFYFNNIPPSIKKITKDSVVSILLNFKTISQNLASEKNIFSERIFYDSIMNDNRRKDLNTVLQCLDSKADEIGISKLEYQTACTRAIDEAFEGFMAWFGILDENKLKNIDNALFEYAEAIRRAEFRYIQKRDDVENALTSTDIEQKINEAFEKSPWLINDDVNYEVQSKLIEEHNLNKEDLFGDGKINSPAVQLTGNCVLHATINSIKQSKKGREILGTLHEKRGGAIAIFLPEAYNNKVGRNGSGVYIYDKGTLKTAIENLSIGDGDISAFAAAEYDYNVHMTKKDAIDKDTHHIYRGFEILSGKRAKFYDLADDIPSGVGFTYGNVQMFDKLRDLIRKGEGACTVSFVSGAKNNNYTIDDAQSNNVSEKQALISSNHAYSVVNFVGDTVYLQESNTPSKYIKLSREDFFKLTSQIATWKF